MLRFILVLANAVVRPDKSTQSVRQTNRLEAQARVLSCCLWSLVFSLEAEFLLLQRTTTISVNFNLLDEGPPTLSLLKLIIDVNHICKIYPQEL